MYPERRQNQHQLKILDIWSPQDLIYTLLEFLYSDARENKTLSAERDIQCPGFDDSKCTRLELELSYFELSYTEEVSTTQILVDKFSLQSIQFQFKNNQYRNNNFRSELLKTNLVFILVDVLLLHFRGGTNYRNWWMCHLCLIRGLK